MADRASRTRKRQPVLATWNARRCNDIASSRERMARSRTDNKRQA
ncbi:hypothetical protein [Xanthomonas arboricola]|uniref:Uncharacterized protein n=2 Tax=Xanthomonas arboricola pv. pruni TaxID=69929 RepID=A0AAP4K919_9XANT|nr:hypothetical protein [Xanthomonas arboricola]MDN0201989.1 hypothetical protein [Xanthomonas arboricola pv. corylina]MDN0209131.1 hypothetical protein [Xanthomonas arboricola pv. corylina]MDN0213536.1 hypothetical protein [Xanthomonas arboricola pv. corylina]MDN0215670.1 hypothetical protein [Xanthomonas arboricola pv. corylina]MDN0223863.1 hypothetical protein [Xanthomonas arboricola pv. juglandis]